MPTAGSPSFSSATSTSIAVDLTDNSSSNPGGAAGSDAMQSCWESISKARSRILQLVSLLHLPDLAALADSDRPARSLLDSPVAYAALSAALSAPSSGSGDGPLCQWLYDTFRSSDPDLLLVALSFVPLLAGLYLSRVVSSSSSNSPSLSGFEAVLLALHATEVKSRGGKPLLVSIPDLSLPSLYHTPRPSGDLSPPLEPQIAVKSTKRACIVAVALDSYYKKISSMPSCSKIDFCEFVAGWAGQDCPCRFELDDCDLKPPLSCSSSLSSSSSSSQIRILAEGDGEIGGAVDYMRRLNIQDSHNGNREEEEDNIHSRGSRVPLPWELLQPVLRIAVNGRSFQNGNQMPEFGNSPNPHARNNGSSTRPPSSSSASLAEAKEKKDNSPEAERIASARKRLRDNYLEAKKAKNQRTMDIQGIPQPKNSFVRKGVSHGKH